MGRLDTAALLLAVATAPLLACGDNHTWTLTPEQRRAYLEYYAPIILKQTDEDPKDKLGRDWISNFRFDRDDVFANNLDHAKQLHDYAIGSGDDAWQVRPTLYTALIEFMEGDSKGAVLLYHVYHFMQKAEVSILGSSKTIHDWERIEIRLDGIQGDPGGPEVVTYATVTTHDLHRGITNVGPFQTGPDAADGKHLVVFQAKAIGDVDGLFGNELHFVLDDWAQVEALRDQESSVCGKCKGKVVIDSSQIRSFQYVFVPESDPKAVHFWEAQEINQENAYSLAARDRDGSQRMWNVERIIYELQDMADIIPTMLNNGSANASWRETGATPQVPILIGSPIRDESGGRVEVSEGLQFFFPKAREQGSAEDSGLVGVFYGDEKKSGFIWKSWFWGTYSWNRNDGGLKGEALHAGGPDGTRCIANRIADCSGFFWQHDYFLHEGVRGDGTFEGEVGHWLPYRWYTVARGGSDGRWIQLFDDDDPPRPKVWLAADRDVVVDGEPFELQVRASSILGLGSVHWFVVDADDEMGEVLGEVNGVEANLGTLQDLGRCAGSYECDFERSVLLPGPGRYVVFGDAEDGEGRSAAQRRQRFAELTVTVVE